VAVNVTIEADDLRGLLGRMKPVRAGAKVWAGKLSASTHGGITLASAGYYTFAEAWGNGSVAEPGEVHIPLGKLDAWLGGVDGRVELSVGDGTVVASTAHAELVLPFVLEGDVVIPPEPDDELALPPRVWSAVPRVAWAADALGESAPIWKNMLHVEPGRVWASDANVIAVATVDGDGPRVSMFPDVAAVARGMDLDTLVTKRDDVGRLHLRDSGGRAVVGTYVGNNPVTVDQFIAAAGKLAVHSVTLSTKELSDAVGHLRRLKAANSLRVVFDPTEGMPLLSVETDDNLAATRDVPFDPVGDPPAVGLNAAKLDGLLDSLNGEQVTFHMGGPRDPILVEDGDLTVIMSVIRLEAKARPEKRRKAA